jgi:hypothetical protein
VCSLHSFSALQTVVKTSCRPTVNSSQGREQLRGPSLLEYSQLSNAGPSIMHAWVNTTEIFCPCTVFLTPYLQTAKQTARNFPKYTRNKRGCFKFDSRKYVVVS